MVAVSPGNPLRKVLLGAIAVQLGLLNKKRFLCGLEDCHHLDPRGLHPFPLVFVDKRWHKTIVQVCDQLIQAHGGHVRQALDALGGMEDVLRESSTDAKHLQDFSVSTFHKTDVDKVRVTTDPAGKYPSRKSSGSRLRILKAHKEGGLGKVSLAHDIELNRRVAFKEIKMQLADNAELRKRFLREAEITGRLEHPGIVPVYGLGAYGDGRPYYAMRFIEGRSLRDHIAEYHSAYMGNSASKENRLELRRLLRHFIDVCHAVDFAHTRGIIHRDIKPENVMIGDFGETLVVDWGLAKPYRQSEANVKQAREAIDQNGDFPCQTVSIEPELVEDLATIPGRAAGTLQYMSPEQARGEVGDLGPATDIFSLGATLYTLMFNQPPIQGATSDLLLQNARESNWQIGRDMKVSYPSSLESICKKAMARDPQTRYASARDLAQDVERFLGDEPVTCHRDELLERLRRWMRKHPKSVASIVATLLVALVSSLYLTSAVSLKKAEALRAQDDTNSVIKFMVEAFRSPDPLRDGKKVTVYEIMKRAETELANEGIASPRANALLHRAIGDTYRGLGLLDEAAKLLERAYDLCSQAFGPVDEETLVTMNNLGTTYREMGHLDSAEKLLSKALMEAELTPSTKSRVILALRNNLALCRAKAAPDESIQVLEESLERARVVLGPDDMDTLTIMNSLAMVYLDRREVDRARVMLEACLELACKRSGEQSYIAQKAKQNLSIAYYVQGRLPDVLRLLVEAHEWKQKNLEEDDVSRLMTANNLALAYQALGKMSDATQLMEDTLTKRRKKLGAGHEDAVDSLKGLIGMYLQSGNNREAESLIRQWDEILAANPSANPVELAYAKNCLAESLLGQGKLAEAEPKSREAIDALTRLVPASIELCRAQSVLGAICCKQDRYSEAEPLLLNAYAELSKNFPSAKPHLRWYAPRACERLMDFYASQEKPNEVEKWKSELARVTAEIQRLREGK